MDFHLNGKRVCYERIGEGPPLLMQHGNTASSRLYDGIADWYAATYQVILLDFPGHGRSERLDYFPLDFWYTEGLAALALLDHLEIEKAHILGTSGGALAGINAALESPERIDCLMADSFGGESMPPGFASMIQKQRTQAKRDPGGAAFWFGQHGPDWERVVDQDTEMQFAFESRRKRYFHADLGRIQAPVLLTASLEDPFFENIETMYRSMAEKIPHANLHLFKHGGHPALLSNAADYFELVKDFLSGG